MTRLYIECMNYLDLFVLFVSSTLHAEELPPGAKSQVDVVGEAHYQKGTSDRIKKDKEKNKEPSDEEKKKYYNLMQRKAKK